MEHVWEVDYLDFGMLEDCSKEDLCDIVSDVGGKLFLTEAKALEYAASLRQSVDEDFTEAKMLEYAASLRQLVDEGFTEAEKTTLVWGEEHEAPNFCWHANGDPGYWNGVVVRVSRRDVE
jgi:hypothetical protein